MAKTEKDTIQKDLQELEEIAKWFENEQELDVEAGLEKVKRGAELAKSLKARLKEVENEFREIEVELNTED
jgi:exonuclease VII small subunit